jgi:hypothetical protein
LKKEVKVRFHCNEFLIIIHSQQLLSAIEEIVDKGSYNKLVEFNTLLCHQISFILFNIIALVTILYQKVILSTFDWVRITTIVDQMFMCGTTDSTIKKHSGARLLNQ